MALTNIQLEKFDQLVSDFVNEDGETKRVDVYIPIVAGGQLVKDAERRTYENQHIRVDHIEVSGKSVIDLGCNTGYVSAELARKGASEVVGVDIKQELVDIGNYVKEVDNLTNLSFVCQNKIDFTLDTNRIFDVGLNMSNFGYQETIDDLTRYGHIAKIWYIEPTNHPHWEEGFWDEDRIKEWGSTELSQFGKVEFLTLTDYQDRGFFKLTMNE